MSRMSSFSSSWRRCLQTVPPLHTAHSDTLTLLTWTAHKREQRAAANSQSLYLSFTFNSSNCKGIVETTDIAFPSLSSLDLALLSNMWMHSPPASQTDKLLSFFCFLYLHIIPDLKLPLALQQKEDTHQSLQLKFSSVRYSLDKKIQFGRLWRLQIQSDTDRCRGFYLRLCKHNLASNCVEHKTRISDSNSLSSCSLHFPFSLTIIPPWYTTNTHFSSCVLACSSLTSACTLSTWSSSFLMVYMSCCFSSNSIAAAEFTLSNAWHLTKEGKRRKTLDLSRSPFPDGFGTRASHKKNL